MKSSADRPEEGYARRWKWGNPGDYVTALGIVAACVVISSAIEPLLPLANLSLVFLVGVLVVAARTATLPAVLTSLVSAVAYNFFFTEPLYTLRIDRTGELLTVAFFLLIGLLGGQMAGRLRRQMDSLQRLNEQNETIAELNRHLAAAPDLPAMAGAVVSVLSLRLRVPVCVLFQNESQGGALEPLAGTGDAVFPDESTRLAAQRAIEHRRPSGRFTDACADVSWTFLPLHAARETFGVVAMRFPLQPPPSREVLRALDVLAAQVSLAMARAQLAAELQRARIAEETERLRSALLSSVSHDLRTPLASMIGSATSLRDLNGDLSAIDRIELLEAIVSEGERLNRYVQNLLDMVRLGRDGLEIARDWIGVDDILNSVLRRSCSLLTGIRVVRDVDVDLPLLYVHPALIEQALVNVIENAARFSPVGGEIRITARHEAGALHIVITDQGPGIPPEQRKQVFDMFFTCDDGDRGTRAGGLGLAISAAMVGAHMGHIEADAGPGGIGTSIHVYLPEMQAPSVEVGSS